MVKPQTSPSTRHSLRGCSAKPSTRGRSDKANAHSRLGHTFILHRMEKYCQNESAHVEFPPLQAYN